MGLYTEPVYTIIPTVFPCFFADLLSLHLLTLLMLFSLVYFSHWIAELSQ